MLALENLGRDLAIANNCSFYFESRHSKIDSVVGVRISRLWGQLWAQIRFLRMPKFAQTQAGGLNGSGANWACENSARTFRKTLSTVL